MFLLSAATREMQQRVSLYLAYGLSYLTLFFLGLVVAWVRRQDTMLFGPSNVQRGTILVCIAVVFQLLQRLFPTFVYTVNGDDPFLTFFIPLLFGLEMLNALNARVTTNLADVIMVGNLRRVAQLLDEEPSLLNQQDRLGRTPLFMAILAGRAEVVAFLLEKGASMSVYLPTHISPLWASVLLADNPQTVKVLLQYGADIQERTASGLTMMHVAAVMNRVGMIEVLCNLQLNINALSLHGDTPLHIAAWHGSVESARWLLSHGADPLLRNDAGESPLDIAQQFSLYRYFSRRKVVKLLTEYKG